MELHGGGSSSGKATEDETDAKVEWADGYASPVQGSVFMVTNKTYSCFKKRVSWRMDKILGISLEY